MNPLRGKTPGETKLVQEGVCTTAADFSSQRSSQVQEADLVCEILKWNDTGQRVGTTVRLIFGSI